MKVNFARIVLGLLVALLAMSAAVRHAWLAPQIGWDAPVVGDEAEILLGLRHVRLGQPLYYDYRQPPHTYTLYMPLFFLVPGTVARVWETGPLATFSVGRAYVYAGWLAVAALVVALARQAGGGRWGARFLAGRCWLLPRAPPAEVHDWGGSISSWPAWLPSSLRSSLVRGRITIWNRWRLGAC